MSVNEITYVTKDKNEKTLKYNLDSYGHTYAKKMQYTLQSITLSDESIVDVADSQSPIFIFKCLSNHIAKLDENEQQDFFYSWLSKINVFDNQGNKSNFITRYNSSEDGKKYTYKYFNSLDENMDPMKFSKLTDTLLLFVINAIFSDNEDNEDDNILTLSEKDKKKSEQQNGEQNLKTQI